MEECETKDNFCANSDESKDGNSIASDIVEDRDTGFVEETLSNSDNFEIESGVESATGDVTEADWTELAELLDLNSYLTGSDESLRLGDLDLTTEQAQETLKYFSEYCDVIFLISNINTGRKFIAKRLLCWSKKALYQILQ